MTYGNLIKNKIQHAFGGLFDTLSIKRKLTDAQMAVSYTHLRAHETQ